MPPEYLGLGCECYLSCSGKQNRAHNPSTGQFILLYHVHAVFFSLSYFSLFWLGYLSKWKLNADDLSIYWDSLLILLYVAVLLFSLVSSFSLPVCLYPTLADGIIVKAAL